MIASLEELPTTDQEWQDLVDCCDGAIAFDAAQKYRVISGGPEINVERAQALLALGAERGFHPRADAAEAFVLSLLDLQLQQQRAGAGVCRVCQCTDEDCSQCVEATGQPCSWANDDHTLCTRCAFNMLQLGAGRHA